MLSAEGIHLAIDGRVLLDGVSLSLLPGELHVLLGANGAGKSSLLKILAGERRGQRGTVSLDGRALPLYSPRALALRRAVLPQGENLRFGFCAREVVALGRLAAQRGRPAEEAALIDSVLAETDALALAGQSYPTLSGGERQRVQLARVLAQLAAPRDAAPRYLLLDEPTAALDLPHQFACLELARRRARAGLGVLAVLHDVNLAARYADRITLLQSGRVFAQGLPQHTLSPEQLATAYGGRLQFIARGGQPRAGFEIRPGTA